MNSIRVGVTGTGSLIGQAVIKSIMNSRFEKNVFLIGFDYFEGTVGAHWVRKNFILPDVLKRDVKEAVWLDAVIGYIKEEGIEILFIGVDFELRLFAKYREIIESRTRCKVVVSDPEVLRIADDKYLTYEFLKDNNLFYPKTILADELQEKAITFPCILKPRFGARSRDVFVIFTG